MSINKRVDKKNIDLSMPWHITHNKKNTEILIYMNNIDNSQTAELKKTSTKEYIPYDFIYMKF